MSELIDPEEHKLHVLKQEQIMLEYNLKDHDLEVEQLKARLFELTNDRVKKVEKLYEHKYLIEDQQKLIQHIKDETAKLTLEEAANKEMEDLMAEIVSLTDDFPALKQARHYQYDDIIATIKAYKDGKNGMLNANDMGAGKTAEAVMNLYIMTKMFEKEYNRKPNTLWLTKKSLLNETPLEIKRWWPGCKVVPAQEGASKGAREFQLELYDMVGGIFMANYEFARTTAEAIAQRTWDFVIVDEVHKLKGGANPSGATAIWEACKNLAIKAKFNQFLTGTPMVNAPEEMWSYLHIFAPTRFPSLKQFKRDYMVYRDIAGTGLVDLVVDPIKILNQALKGQMIRRSRSEFGIELPELEVQDVHLKMLPEQKELYNQMRDRFFIWLDEQGTDTLSAAAIIAQLTRLRQINTLPSGIKVERGVAKAIDNELLPDDVEFEIIGTYQKFLECNESSKIEESMDRIQMICSMPSPIDESIREQVVVFCTFNAPLREIQSRCIESGLTCETIAGDEKTTRNYAKEFQDGKINVLCVNSAMGEGLNLQKNPEQWIGGASYGILLDKWWSPARNDQCIGRIHRQGGTYPVTIYNMINEHSIDAYIQAKNDEKTEKFASIMDSDVIRPKGEWRNYLQGLL